jgi:hypothetical protein
MGGCGARARWEAAGRPILPSLLVDGVATPVLHVSQIADALGLPWRPRLPPSALARDTVVLLETWLTGIAGLALVELLAPTPSRGRSLRNLTVNVFHPFELLPAAWVEGSFPWDPDRDGQRESALVDADALTAYARRTLERWSGFLDDVREDLDAGDREVTSPRGRVSFAVLLDTQRWHAAYHLRQLAFAVKGVTPPALEQLALPVDLF